MHVVILIPGIMGTELLLPGAEGDEPEKVWPPTPLETQFGYKRRDKLADSRVIPGEIISKVLCFEFYRPLSRQLAKLGFSPNGVEKRLIAFAYDWRLDLFDTAHALAGVLDLAHADGATRISLIAHSMGGLVCRLLLEDLLYRDRPWFANIDQLVAIATPHLGAPLALARVLGQDSATGISGEDFAWLSGLEAYPSAYQLLPAPGESACWNQNDASLAAFDIHDPATASLLGLKPALLSRVEAMHRLLGAGNRPNGVRYFYFAATGHRTVTRVNLFLDAAGEVMWDQTSLTRTSDGGDGTVPLYSALPSLGQRHIATNDHVGAFTGEAFRRVFVRLLGGNAGHALEAAAGPIAISVEAPLVPQGEQIEVLLHAASAGDDAEGLLSDIDGTIVLTRVSDSQHAVAAEERRVPIRYDGPPLARLRLYLEPINEPGHYTLSFDGSPASVALAAFAVCAPLARRFS